MTVSDRAQIASYQVSELIAQNMKAHTLSESLILPACKKIVSTMLENEAAMIICTITLSNDMLTGVFSKCLLILRKMYVKVNYSVPVLHCKLTSQPALSTKRNS